MMTSGILSIALVLAAGAPPEADRPAEEARLFFILLADPQLGFSEANEGFARESENLTRAVAHINRLRPAFVVVAGDLVNRSGDAAQAGEYRRILATVRPGIPVHPVAGNHDLGDFPTPSSLAWFRKTFGPDRGSFEAGGWKFIWIDTTVLLHPRDCPEEAREEREFLRRELEAPAPRPIALFQHHPWFVEKPDERDGYFGLTAALRRELLGALRDSGVRVVFAGHLHRCAEGSAGRLEMVTASALGKPLGKNPSGLLIGWVFADRIVHRYYALDEVPREVSLRGPPRGLRRL